MSLKPNQIQVMSHVHQIKPDIQPLTVMVIPYSVWTSSDQKYTGKMCECAPQRVISWLQEKANTQLIWLTHRSCFFLTRLPAAKHLVLVY